MWRILFGLFLFGAAAEAGDRAYYNKKTRPKIDDFLIRENMNLDEFYVIAKNALPKGSGVLKYLRAELGIEEPSEDDDE